MRRPSAPCGDDGRFRKTSLGNLLLSTVDRTGLCDSTCCGWVSGEFWFLGCPEDLCERRAKEGACDYTKLRLPWAGRDFFLEGLGQLRKRAVELRPMQVVPVFDPASPQAKAIADLFYIVLGVCGVILVIVTGLITWSLIRFRGGRGQPEPPQLAGKLPLEIAWTLIPFFTVVGLFILTAHAMSLSKPLAGGAAPNLIIIAHQWWWEARYPASGAITANEIHIPAGARWLVRLESADVIHDFWVPQLGPKMDNVPGHPNYVWLEANQPGTYEGACAEYCGTQHAWMRILVVAQAPADFEAWERHQLQPMPRPAQGAAAQGAQLFQTLTCANCHGLGGVVGPAAVAPDLGHVAERRTLATGVLRNTPENLFRWLKNPQAYKPGCLMPNLKLSDQQAAALTAYLEGGSP
jgi:cytochrome c oxidase subunit II